MFGVKNAEKWRVAALSGVRDTQIDTQNDKIVFAESPKKYLPNRRKNSDITPKKYLPNRRKMLHCQCGGDYHNERIQTTYSRRNAKR